MSFRKSEDVRLKDLFEAPREVDEAGLLLAAVLENELTMGNASAVISLPHDNSDAVIWLPASLALSERDTAD